MSTDAIERLFALAIERIDDPKVEEELKKILDSEEPSPIPDVFLKEDEEEEEEIDENNLIKLIKDLNFAGKIKLGMLGNMTARALLVRDTNRLVQSAVLGNPKLTENEVIDFAKNPNLDENVFRTIARNGTWMKAYAVKVNLLGNPKTPVDVGLRWMKFLKDKDLRALAKSKGIPQVLATQCRKLLEKRQKK